ncbi:MAG TPA: adenylate/guanylate cyclase domain-containing protein, partial [Candidatus Binatia bacterium]
MTIPGNRDSERRYATIFFADISGFTAMSEKIDPEEVTLIMNGCFQLMEEIVRNHGGEVDKYIGDCVMALFGVPNAIENAPAQALNAAIEMRRRLDDFNREKRLVVELRTHIGVNTGLVLAGQVGGNVKRDFTVMGDTVNLASRLKDVAPNGSIYVGLDTYRATQHQFEYRELRPLTLKGKELPVMAFELTSASTQVHRPRAAAGDRMIFSEMVGRARELEQLRAAFTRARGREGGIVSVVAEAGLGKSRLTAEAISQWSANDLTVLEGRSLSMGATLSYHPFVDLLRSWARIIDGDAEQDSLRKLEVALRTELGDEAIELFPFIATMMGMRPGGDHAERLQDIRGEAMERMILKSVRELLLGLARTRPLVLVFEDLHWADLSSVKLLEAILKIAV